MTTHCSILPRRYPISVLPVLLLLFSFSILSSPFYNFFSFSLPFCNTSFSLYYFLPSFILVFFSPLLFSVLYILHFPFLYFPYSVFFFSVLCVLRAVSLSVRFSRF
uniref:Uncharacterized protein n=1 Tax=Cacopsylla melanoneura TaxID=428564 RepID=A0A8D8X2F4_9HEMI